MQIGPPVQSASIEPLRLPWNKSSHASNRSAHGNAWTGTSGVPNAPDCGRPQFGYRLWQWDVRELKSLNATTWTPEPPLVATCRAANTRKNAIHNASSIAVDRAPQSSCTCGIYATRTLDRLRGLKQWKYAPVYGEVWLWGRVIEHEHGYRAELAYPSRLFLKAERLPISVAALEERIENLSAYGCDLFLVGEHSIALLWRKNEGIHAAGIRFLTRRSVEWYGSHRRITKLTPWGRIGTGTHSFVKNDHFNVPGGKQLLARLKDLRQARVIAPERPWVY